MQWKLGPVWQPCSGQSNTGSIQSFWLQPLPPSPVLPELLPLLLPPNRPPSGSVIGGKVMPLLELVAPLLLPLTPLLEEGAEPSSPDAPDLRRSHRPRCCRSCSRRCSTSRSRR
jgi:hypothetical protein